MPVAVLSKSLRIVRGLRQGLLIGDIVKEIRRTKYTVRLIEIICLVRMGSFVRKLVVRMIIGVLNRGRCPKVPSAAGLEIRRVLPVYFVTWLTILMMLISGITPVIGPSINHKVASLSIRTGIGKNAEDR